MPSSRTCSAADELGVDGDHDPRQPGEDRVHHGISRPLSAERVPRAALQAACPSGAFQRRLAPVNAPMWTAARASDASRGGSEASRKARRRSLGERRPMARRKSPSSPDLSRPRILGRDKSPSPRGRAARGRLPARIERVRGPRDVINRRLKPSEARRTGEIPGEGRELTARTQRSQGTEGERIRARLFVQVLLEAEAG